MNPRTPIAAGILLIGASAPTGSLLLLIAGVALFMAGYDKL